APDCDSSGFGISEIVGLAARLHDCRRPEHRLRDTASVYAQPVMTRKNYRAQHETGSVGGICSPSAATAKIRHCHPQ
ncbi:MAG: hypothetical protein ABWY78_04025, partial [Microvirga sp.]